jgi:glycosyltransferase involved in cell wall biosynthesis
MKYKILHTEWSSGWGGQEQRIVLECRKMLDLGHQVMLACQPDSAILIKAREQGIPVEVVPIRRSWDLTAILKLSRLIKRHGITIVNTHSGKDTWVGGLAAKLSGVTFFRTRHLSIPLSRSPLNFIHRLADGTITTGVTIRDAMIARNRIPPERILSIATGVNAQRFDPENVSVSEALRGELGLQRNAPVITMVAVLRGMKRHDVLLNAAKIVLADVPQAQFLAVGDGPGRENLMQLARQLGIEKNMLFCGHRSDVPQILALSDIALLTSDRFEGVPQSLSQAMAMALPVVASPIGSIPELIRDGSTGLFAEAGSPESFARQILRLLDDRQLRERLGAAAREHILEYYTDDIMARTTIDFYTRISGHQS